VHTGSGKCFTGFLDTWCYKLVSIGLVVTTHSAAAPVESNTTE